MPRYRTISCDYCGFMQLKRDRECEGCGRLTRRERRLWIAKSIQVGIVLVVGFVFYARVKGLVPG
ncbi:hypothetical protein H9645_03565 [Luteimonas sp. Sa2BVA3]|uniref:DUF2116 family Zn-ribbon domain-containing protein n=1 Tax=Luteimonas colneyensis TaxID=2762230 RepID=A0ABR8UGE4_9GAMM|nr:hypothetical protein [Luteimonas colneyensis]MBD7987099.1 hypothetical protein [Luteimonas colneyensis]